MNAARRSLFALPIVGVLCLLSPPALATWPHDPTVNVPLCTAANNQFNAVTVSDGAGGAIVAWQDTRTGSSYDIYVQRVNAAGLPQWTANGVALCTDPNNQFTPAIASDGVGGAIVTWYDFRSGTNEDIYAQRVNAAGVPQWTANGVALCTATNDQFSPTIASDGAGGAFVAWYDARSGITYDVYAQRVNASGAIVAGWPANGIAISTAANDQISPTIVADGASGAIITWFDSRGGSYDIYAQRVNGAGATQWTANGVALCTAAGNQLYPTISADGASGAIVTWQDGRGGTYDIYAQRVNAAGATQWAIDGVALCTAASGQLVPTIVSDGSGGAFVTWQDNRSATYDIYAQRVSTSGAPQWAADGVALCTAANSQNTPTIAADGAGGAIVTWLDGRNGVNNDIYAQRISAAGVPQWTFNGVAVCTAANYQYNPMIVSDGAGGAIVAWYDLRDGATDDIYVQRVERFGQLGNPEPTIATVRDVPNDQGGKIKLSWFASYLDADPDYSIGSYWIWRSVPPNVAQAAFARGARLLREGETPVDGEGQLDGARGQYTTTVEGATTIFWEYVGSQIASSFPGYSYVVPTASDSVAGSNPRTLVLVQSRPNYGPAFWNSAPDSGYSVDNLPPAPPAPFVGAYSAGATHLHWGANHEADFAGYRLYRGSSSGFVPGPGNLVSAQPDTGFGDVGPAGSWYKLSAVDSHGNESLFAVLGPGGTVDAPAAGAFALAFAAPAPNPVRGEGASFRLALPTEARVSLTLFDQQGRRVRELLRGTVPAGERYARWDGRDEAGHAVPSGIYFARLEAIGQTMRVRFAVVR